jgi:acetyl coenzyme A synthetase (ADP forming)-like protein
MTTQGSTGVEILLRDGSTAHVRDAVGDDRAALETFFTGLSERSRELRFFSTAVNVAAAARLAADVAAKGGLSLVATRGNGDLLAHAMYGAPVDDEAEVAFAVADALHGSGISTTLLAHLAERAEDAGLAWFTAEVLPENHKMIDVFRESGFDVTLRSLPGVIDVRMPTALSPEARERFEIRERTAAANAVRSVLEPSSVAVVGASRRPGSVGHETLRNILAAEFDGPVYAVNANGGHVASLPAYRSVRHIAGPVDLAVIATPAAAVVDVARDCAVKGVRALVVLSAGFAEADEEGAERQQELLSVCRAAGMRLIGPNCLGVINTDTQIRLNASFAPAFPPPGPIGFLSQSGALGLAIIDHSFALGLGLTSFVSNGNKADISGNDLLEYWEEHDATEVIVLYLESFGNPRRFSRIARRVARRKPILAVKSGRSAAGAKATSSHTGALVSASDVPVDALFRQAGVVRTDTLAQLFEVARLLADQPVPRGPRVGIVTNAGGLGIMCADACEAAGLEVPELPDRVREVLGGFLNPTAATTNPVDMIATAGGDDYRRTIAALADSGAVDAIIAIFIPPLVTRPEEAAAAMTDASASLRGRLPLLAVFSSHDLPDELDRTDSGLPVYTYPEDAVAALSKAVVYGTWLERDQGTVPAFESTDDDGVAATIAGALVRGPGWLEPGEVTSVLSCYGIALPESRLVRTAEAVADAARELGGTVAIKAVAPGLLHKTDVGGVEAGVAARAAGAAARRIAAAVEAAGHELEGLLVQRMAPPGVEMLVGMVNDPVFGPVIACGGGGTTAEVIGDVAVRLTPVTDRDAREMVESLRTFPLLRGYRGAPPADLNALHDVILRLSALVEEHPEIVEVDLNPVIVAGDAATVVDARIRVEAPPPRKPWPSL